MNGGEHQKKAKIEKVESFKKSFRDNQTNIMGNKRNGA